MDGARLLPFSEGDSVPAGWLATIVEGLQPVVIKTHVLRTKTFSIPLAVFAPRFEAADAKARNCPVVLNEGRSANEFAGVIPSRVEARVVEGVQAVTVKLKHVSRT